MAPDIALRHADARTRLATYLNDHLGGSTTGRELARRTLQANRGNEYGVVLEDVVRQIEEDMDALEELMDRLGVTGKLALWQALRPVLANDLRVEGFDFARLIERAQKQRRSVERLRRRAALEALA